MKRYLVAAGLWLGLFGLAQAVIPQTLVGNVAYTILNTDVNLITTTAFSTGRTWTLPYAAGTNVNALQIFDAAGAISATNQLTIAPQSGDTINGNAANLILSGAGFRATLFPTSGNNWNSTIYGDYNSAVVATGSAVSLTTNTAADIVTLSLSQGDWLCWGTVSRNVGATTSFTKMSASIGTTTNTLVAQGTSASTYQATAANVVATAFDTKVGPFRTALTSTTTLRLVAQDTFTVSTDAAYGELACRRIK